MQQLAGPPDTLSGGRLVRVEGAGDLMRPRSKLTSSDSLSSSPTGDLVVQKEATRVKGRGHTPPTLRYRHAMLVGPYN